ncbi:hypothetical protein Hanom_Chr04g00296031 [Helianthus anomalus]
MKPQGPRCKRFQIWTKIAKMTKPQGPKWQFTLNIINVSYVYSLNDGMYQFSNPQEYMLVIKILLDMNNSFRFLYIVLMTHV